MSDLISASGRAKPNISFKKAFCDILEVNAIELKVKIFIGIEKNSSDIILYIQVFWEIILELTNAFYTPRFLVVELKTS